MYDFDGDHVIIKEGYSALSLKVAATLDIRLNTEVKCIKLDDAQSCVEVVASCAGKITSHRAGYVVVTLPLGVLKSRVVSLNLASMSAISRSKSGYHHKDMLTESLPHGNVGFHTVMLTE